MDLDFSTTDDKRRPSLSVTAEGAENAAGHVVPRGEVVDEISSLESEIVGYDAERMKARALLTETEERRLMRRVDWHLMPLCSLMFLLKNMDYQNVRVSILTPEKILTMNLQAANARIMNKGTHQNILTQLGMTSNGYNFKSTIYYVSLLAAFTFC